MSGVAVTWAWHQRVGNPMRKLLLLHLADASSAQNGWESWYSMRAMAKRCETHVNTVRRHLRALEAEGYITTVRASTTLGQTTRYRLNVGSVHVQIGHGSGAESEQVGGNGVVPEREEGGTREVGGVVPEKWGGGTREVPKPVKEPINRNKGEGDRASPRPAGPTLEDHQAACAEAYHRYIPWGVRCQKWTKERVRALRALVRDNPEIDAVDFWPSYFAEAARDKFIRGEVPPRPGQDPYKPTIDYLIRGTVYAKLFESACDRADRAERKAS